MSALIVLGFLALVVLGTITLLIVSIVKLTKKFNVVYLITLIISGILTIFIVLSIFSSIAFYKVGSYTNKAKSRADIQNASIIGTAIIRGIIDGELSGIETDAEITSPQISKVLSKTMPQIPTVKKQQSYKWFISYNSTDGKVIIKSGEHPETAVILYPRPDKLPSPYDDIEESNGSSFKLK